MTPAKKKAAKKKKSPKAKSPRTGRTAGKAVRKKPARKARPKASPVVTRPATVIPFPARPVPAPKPVPVMSKAKFLKLNPSFIPLMIKLQDRRNQITGQVGNLESDLKDDMADTQNTPGDLADHGSGELNQHLSVTLMENDRIELERIDRALQRFEDATYGRCEVCSKPIPMMRLKAIPWATRCINCQSRTETV